MNATFNFSIDVSATPAAFLGMVLMMRMLLDGSSSGSTCGSDGVLYTSQCHLRQQSCRLQVEIHLSAPARCRGKCCSAARRILRNNCAISGVSIAMLVRGKSRISFNLTSV